MSTNYMTFGSSTVHLHAGFRTGSTLAWSSSNKDPDNFAFYEPLHERLADLAPGEQWNLDDSISDILGNDSDVDMFSCYAPILNGMNGVKNFRKSFSYERYFLDPLEGNNALAHYLRSLELFARSRRKRPVLKYVRSQGRIAWIKRTCGGVHFALARACFDQFRSYVWNGNRGNLYFLAATCEIFAKNVSVFDAELAAKLVRIEAFFSTNAAEEQAHYQRIAAGLTLQQLYFVHAYLWKRQFRHALEAADAVFSIYAPPERLAEFDAFSANHDIKLDLSTARLSRAESDLRHDERFARLEALADYCLWDAGHVRPLKAGGGAARFLDAGLEAEAEAAARLSTHGPFERYSPMELLSALSDRALKPAPPEPCGSSAFGAVPIQPPLLTVPHRLTGDDDDILRVDARAMYVAPGAALRRDPLSQTDAIVSSQSAKSLIGFGPHWSLPRGSYEVAMSYHATPRPGAGQASAEIDIVADYGNIIVQEPVELELKGPAVQTLRFEARKLLPAFEVRVTATDAEIHLFGYIVRRLPDGAASRPA
ncbi:hypothetical protein [Caulobacter sp. BK020]|uniref:hypothetical protein n=1 Tax=Caulobacter sp. BK020 TaxID=2512117 RepID=UPI00104EC59E|nr:hypothetical protein [Caulobacter sp. BK020]